MHAPDLPRTTARSHLARLGWLMGCLFAGLVVASVGESLTGNPYWYLAIPAAIAAGWMLVANPAECLPPGRASTKRETGDESAPRP